MMKILIVDLIWKYVSGSENEENIDIDISEQLQKKYQTEKKK